MRGWCSCFDTLLTRNLQGERKVCFSSHNLIGCKVQVFPMLKLRRRPRGQEVERKPYSIICFAKLLAEKHECPHHLSLSLFYFIFLFAAACTQHILANGAMTGSLGPPLDAPTCPVFFHVTIILPPSTSSFPEARNLFNP